MKYAIHNAQGDITRIGHCPDGEEILQTQPGELVWLGEATLHDRVDIATGELVVNGRPPRPGLVYDWDEATKQWVGNPEKARAVKKREIEKERDARLAAPILVYDGVNLDADMASLGRLADKLTTTGIMVANGVEPPVQTLVWHDADNIDHTFPDLASYRAWLEGFALAADSRAMAAFAWSWQRKAVLEALTSFEEIQAFNPTE